MKGMTVPEEVVEALSAEDKALVDRLNWDPDWRAEDPDGGLWLYTMEAKAGGYVLSAEHQGWKGQPGIPSKRVLADTRPWEEKAFERNNYGPEFRENPRPRRGLMPAVHHTNETGGKFRWHTHRKGKDREDAMPCIPDYACETGRRYWKDYYQDPKTGLAGPRPFRSNAEQKAYEELTGQRTLEKGEQTWDASKHRRKVVEDCAKLLRTTPAEVERQVSDTMEAARRARKARAKT